MSQYHTDTRPMIDDTDDQAFWDSLMSTEAELYVFFEGTFDYDNEDDRFVSENDMPFLTEDEAREQGNAMTAAEWDYWFGTPLFSVV